MLEERVGVDCHFAVDGTVDVRRVFFNEAWQTVGQGRQWVDRQGRHVLIMLAGDDIQELLLHPDTLTWTLRPIDRRQSRVV